MELEKDYMPDHFAVVERPRLSGMPCGGLGTVIVDVVGGGMEVGDLLHSLIQRRKSPIKIGMLWTGSNQSGGQQTAKVGLRSHTSREDIHHLAQAQVASLAVSVEYHAG